MTGEGVDVPPPKPLLLSNGLHWIAKVAGTPAGKINEVAYKYTSLFHNAVMDAFVSCTGVDEKAGTVTCMEVVQLFPVRSAKYGVATEFTPGWTSRIKNCTMIVDKSRIILWLGWRPSEGGAEERVFRFDAVLTHRRQPLAARSRSRTI